MSSAAKTSSSTKSKRQRLVKMFSSSSGGSSVEDGTSCSRGNPSPREPLKLVILGGGGVGKTSLVCVMLGLPPPRRHEPTVEDLHELELGEGARLHLLDTAGSYAFPAMRRLAIASGDAFIVVFSLGDEASLRAAAEAVDEVKQARTFGPPLMLFGTRPRSDSAAPFREQGHAEAARLGVMYGESTFESGHGAWQALYRLLKASKVVSGPTDLAQQVLSQYCRKASAEDPDYAPPRSSDKRIRFVHRILKRRK